MYLFLDLNVFFKNVFVAVTRLSKQSSAEQTKEPLFYFDILSLLFDTYLSQLLSLVLNTFMFPHWDTMVPL
jgi:hypothetical protein